MNTESDIVLMTVCNGRIGTAVTGRLAVRFSDLFGVDQSASAPPPAGYTRTPVDVGSDESVREGLRTLRLAGVYDDVCHSPPLAHQIQRIYDWQLVGRLHSGEISHGSAFVHLEDVVDATARAVG